MENENPSKSESQSLARMMDLEAGARGMWEPEELGAILEHQLAAPLELDLVGLDPGLAEKLRLARQADPRIESFKDLLLRHANPPVECLELIKEFAKVSRGRPDGPLPDEIATVLYFLSIVAGIIKCRRRITRLDDEALRHGLEWALDQPWLDESTRRLFQEGYRTLR